MKKKVTVLTLSAMLFALSFVAQAQQPKKITRIGYLTAAGSLSFSSAFARAARARLRGGTEHCH